MTMNIATLSILAPLLLLLLGLGVTAALDPYLRREHRRIMLVIVALCLSLILFLCIIDPEGKKRLAWTAAGVNAALYFSSPRDQALL